MKRGDDLFLSLAKEPPLCFQKEKKEKKMNKTGNVQEWLPFQEILQNGIIKLKNNSLVKILTISPVNFNLKSTMEKEAILTSYKTFLKTCNFNIQILIQSNKEDLSKHISQIEKQNKNEEENIFKLSQEYINFIQNLNLERKSSSKNFYILIKEVPQNKKQKLEQNEENIACEKLNDDYFKIKEALSRCGNTVTDSNSKESTERIMYSFLNSRKEMVSI